MNKNLLLKLAIFMMTLTCLSDNAIADIIQKKDTVSGIVIDKNKQPLPGAKVEIMGQSYSAYTDIDGRFKIKCDPGAKKVKVFYPKFKAAKKKIKPDMTVQIGRSWKQVPEHYQWFVGANIGVGLISTDIKRLGVDYEPTDDRHYDADFVSPTISLMAGRVKAVGWYVKTFVNPSVRPNEDWSNSDNNNRCSNFGAILGGMVRLGCPLHLYLGGGYVHTSFSNLKKNEYDYSNAGWQFDMGLLFRIKDNFGINWSLNAGAAANFEYLYGSYTNLGICYFFNK